MEDNTGRSSSENKDDEYMGNIWGWKLSFISLGIIVAMLLLMGVRYLTMDKTTIPENQHTTEQDSLFNRTIPKKE